MFRNSHVLTRLDRLEAKLDQIEAMLRERPQVAELVEEVERKREQLDALSQQSLHVVELLNEARLEVERWKHGGGDVTPTA